MATELKIPEVGESITEVQIAKWLKQKGDTVDRDEPVAELETDKVSLELPAPIAGRITELKADEGATVNVGDVVALISQDDEMDVGEEEQKKEKKEEADQKKPDPPKQKQEDAESGKDEERAANEKEKGDEEEGESVEKAEAKEAAEEDREENEAAKKREREERGENEAEAESEEEAEDTKGAQRREPREKAKEKKKPRDDEAEAEREGKTRTQTTSEREEEAVAMSPMRKRIAERLVEAQRTAAMLTTFNEVDMSVVIDLRQRYRERFRQKHGVKLGFMSFFVKAAVDALHAFPQVNAMIRDEQIVYRNYCDVGVAIATDAGLVAPIIRDADQLGFADIEKVVDDFATRAWERSLGLDELSGGTFTITNGGVFGSLLSTPIINPPQSAVLGMHTIQKRPIATDDDEVVVRPMMYVALTYDHRLIDGREAVLFLGRIKEAIESPAAMMLDF